MMASALQFNKLLYATAATTSDAPSETQSEISSADSGWSDIRAIAVRLGVSNPEDLHTERFKVDRHKLENMIKVESNIEGLNSAEYFFESVMKTTETYISWPCRLKIGAKSKKDPHVRIVGKPDDVNRAKERILANLDSRGSRVIMKMDVSYTDHSYIIGRGGNNIKRIMEDTATHIHFPDSNRSNPTEKSNQVSLCGSLEGVERARALVRLSTPLLMSFELPIRAEGEPIPDHDTPYIKEVEIKFNVQVIFSSRPKLHSSLVLVKGSEKDADKVQEATQLLINCTCGKHAGEMLVQMQLEISPQHHEIVKGKNNGNLVTIMERTKTEIRFPELCDANVKPIRRSQVVITGTIGGVYKARQQLVGNLPIALIFDFPDNQNDAMEIMSLSTKYGVFISLRQKQRQSTMAIIIKGVEKFIDKIYEARHEILRLKTLLVKPEIPLLYFSPKDQEVETAYRRSLTSLLASYPDSPLTPTNVAKASSSTVSPQMNANAFNNNNNNNNTMTQNMNNYAANKYHGTPTGICAPTQKYLQAHNNSFHRNQPNNNNNYLQVSPSTPVNCISPRNTLNTSRGSQTNTNATNANANSHNTSGYQSFSSSTTSLEQAYPPYSGQGQGGQSHGPYSPDSTYSSEAGCRGGRRSSDGVLLGLGGAGGVGGAVGFGPGSEIYRNQHFDLRQRVFDFDMKRIMGFKAMERAPISGELRTPNANWIGLALSRTSPAPLETGDDNNAWNRSSGCGVAPNAGAGGASVGGGAGADGGGGRNGNGGNNNNSNNNANAAIGAAAAATGGIPISPYCLGATTGMIDSTPLNRRIQMSQHKNMHSLLTTLGLEHYIKTFVTNEIDLEMFTTLTEDDLIQMGITAFGARKKLLVAIHTMQANEVAALCMPSSSNSSPRFSGSAAPGAERRTSNGW
ncbi:protein bicaudal C [Episyrphus balteatus]|uniref:protein bicaudal C n=1 Tax=Episyrphus balteatus TaxID=286459 RepID=UPI002486577A|nr:protein bicaudal C [Episyrphus balteatus]XP_055851866.1 protein bicaudal C [Episyrphus balteatus]